MRALPFILLVLLLAGPVGAAYEDIAAYRSVTFNGPNGILVSLQFENFIPIDQARVFYNWISISVLVLIGAIASSRTTRFVAILVPAFAALFVFFGWMTNANPAHPEQLWGIIVITALIAAAVYMKGSLHEKFGIAGPGSLLFNVVFFIIILQAMVGFVNSTALWDYNTAPSASTKYSGFDLGAEVNTLSGTGGGALDVAGIGTMFTLIMWGCFKLFISIAASLILFSGVVGVIYPWIPASPYGLAFLVVMQVGIYIIYITAFIRFTQKNAVEGDF